MEHSLILGGNVKHPDPFIGTSVFYKDYTYRIANAGLMDIAQAIGNAKDANRSTLTARIECLNKAADLFSYTSTDIEHTVKLTGMPISLIQPLFEDIPNILRSVPKASMDRFPNSSSNTLIEGLGGNVNRMFVPENGFCYAVTPANDPRATAIVAANLCSVGIPFILKASKEDGVAQLIIKALIAGGFDPKFCSLLYFDSNAPDAAEKHFKLVDNSSIVWTFGSNETVDRTLRYEVRGKKIVIDDSKFINQQDPSSIAATLLNLNEQALKNLIQIQDNVFDHFQGKIILRHGSGNCATVFHGPFSNLTGDFLYKSIGYAIGCNATKSAMIVNGQGWTSAASEFLSSLRVGDPLNPETQIGYVHPQNLKSLSQLVERNKAFINTYGFKILSPIQATPLLIETKNKVPDFFGQEIPAYVLAVRECDNINEAIDTINYYSNGSPRLAVSFFDVPAHEILTSAIKVLSHSIFVNQPTTTVIPYYHEGNDYSVKMGREKIISDFPPGFADKAS